MKEQIINYIIETYTLQNFITVTIIFLIISFIVFYRRNVHTMYFSVGAWNDKKYREEALRGLEVLSIKEDNNGVLVRYIEKISQIG